MENHQQVYIRHWDHMEMGDRDRWVLELVVQLELNIYILVEYIGFLKLLNLLIG